MISQKPERQIQKYSHLNDAPMPVLVASGKGLVVEYANEETLAIVQRPSDKVEGLPLHDIFPAIFSLEAIRDIYNKCILEGATHILNEVQVIVPERTNSKIFCYNIMVNPVCDDEGRRTGVILFFSDGSRQMVAAKSIDPRDQLSMMNDLLVTKISALNDSKTVLQQLVDSSIEHIAVMDRDLRFMVVNTPLEKFINRSRFELIGRHILDVYEEARGSGQMAALERALAGETVHIRVNPSISRPHVWFDTHFVPLVINERVEGVISLSRDISDIVKSEQELANVNRQLAEAQRLAKLGSWEWDVATGNVLWSEEMYRIYGYDDKFPVDFVRATERMSPDDAEKSSRRTQQHIQLAMDHFKKTGDQVFEVSSIEFQIELPDGEQKWVRNSGKIQLTSDGKLHRIVGIVQDVTNIRSAEEQLRVLVRELELRNKELESFNYVASHDLQEPLRKIQNFIDRIRNGTLDQKAVDDHLLRINNSARRMHELIQSMLTLSSLSGPASGFGEVDLNTVLGNCKSDLELVISEKDARIESDVLPVVMASPFQMSQLFGNLIGNALKFSNERPHIRITCNKVMGSEIEQPDAAVDKAYWRLSFTDNGIGFDPKYKKQIFDVFQRLHPKNEFSGTGIGLSIVKRIIERHSGFIEANSAPGKGACFSVWLPCTP